MLEPPPNLIVRSPSGSFNGLKARIPDIIHVLVLYISLLVYTSRCFLLLRGVSYAFNHGPMNAEKLAETARAATNYVQITNRISSNARHSSGRASSWA